MEGPARLGDYPGLGVLELTTGENGTRLFEGLWQADEPELAYEELHRHYMAREKLRYHGPVKESLTQPPAVREFEVIILEWSNEEHPAAIKLQEAAEGSG